MRWACRSCADRRSQLRSHRAGFADHVRSTGQLPESYSAPPRLEVRFPHTFFSAPRTSSGTLHRASPRVVRCFPWSAQHCGSAAKLHRLRRLRQLHPLDPHSGPLVAKATWPRMRRGTPPASPLGRQGGRDEVLQPSSTSTTAGSTCTRGRMYLCVLNRQGGSCSTATCPATRPASSPRSHRTARTWSSASSASSAGTGSRTCAPGRHPLRPGPRALHEGASTEPRPRTTASTRTRRPMLLRGGLMPRPTSIPPRCEPRAT